MMQGHSGRFPVRRLLGLGAALLLAAGCADEPTGPLGPGPDAGDGGPALAVQLTCAVDVKAESMSCDPSSPSSAVGGSSMNLVVGSQHRYVRLANDAPSVTGDVWSANVTVQNLTLQPFGTLDGTAAEVEGVRVFFVDEPNNGVVVLNHDGESDFTGAGPQKYHEYAAGMLGADGILTGGEVSSARPWQFQLNGATVFTFSVLVWTEVPDPAAYGVRLARVVAGMHHSCGETSDGKVYCWGSNAHGQLGDGDVYTRSILAPVVAPAGIALSGVIAGGQHNCASGDDGRRYCWGKNNQGQLGDGTTTDQRTPVALTEPEGVAFTALALGGSHSCADGDGGRVYCWGENSDGQLGDGTSTSRALPVPVSAPDGVTLSGVSAGTFHSCAEGSDGNAWCWGYNQDGQLGDGTDTGSFTPVKVAAPTGVRLTNLAAGDVHTCAEGSDGYAYCWGRNSDGRLGDGSTTQRLVPSPVVTPFGVTLTAFQGGGWHTCALGSDGNLYCWGSNFHGQVGDGTNVTHATPSMVRTPTGESFNAFSVGLYHTCATSTNGDEYCWGNNEGGRLGDGTTVNRNRPVLVAGTRRG